MKRSSLQWTVRELIKTVRGVCFFHALRLVARNFEVTRRACLILAPHPDDETFGCAGLIALKRRLGVTVDVVFLTAGEAAHSGCCCRTPIEVVAARRWESTREALAKLGVPEERLHRLGLPDGKIPGKGATEFAEAVKRLAGLFCLVGPEEIYLPHPQEGWPDHVASSDLGWAASALYPLPHQLIGYPVWMWYTLRLGNFSRPREWQPLRLDIAAVRSEKAAAIRHYLAAVNPVCGIPYCGRLPKGFLLPFQKDCEIFFQPRGERCL